MFLRAEGKGIHVDTLIRVSGVRLVGLDPREVGSFALREAVLAVKLELGSDDGVLAPAVEVQRGLGQNESASIRDGGVIKVTVGQVLEGSEDRGINAEVRVLGDGNASQIGLIVGVLGAVPVSSEASGDIIVKSTSIVEETTGINVSTRVSSNRGGATESMDGIGERIDGISVVEGLGTEDLEQESIAHKGRAIVNVLIGLDNPDKLLNGVVKVELDLVTG
jgi:hypothetical protein